MFTFLNVSINSVHSGHTLNPAGLGFTQLKTKQQQQKK